MSYSNTIDLKKGRLTLRSTWIFQCFVCFAALQAVARAQDLFEGFGYFQALQILKIRFPKFAVLDFLTFFGLSSHHHLKRCKQPKTRVVSLCKPAKHECYTL